MPALTTITILGVTFQALYVVAFVASVALSYVLSSINKPDGLRGSNQTDPGVRAQVPPDTTSTMPVVYGDAYIGGRFVDACIQQNQSAMYYVHAISCISENGQFSFDTTKFYYGDRLITFDTTGGYPNRVVSLTDGAGNVDTTIYNLLFISLFTSDKDGNITPINTNGKMPWEFLTVPEGDGTSLLMGTGSTLPTEQQWTATGRRMNGLAFAVIRLGYSREAGTTQLQPITYHASQYLYGTGVARPGDVWRDYMINTVYGAAVDSEFVDTDYVGALNEYSDELITFDDYEGNPQTQPRYRINGVVDTNKAVLKNIDDIMAACDSWLRYEASTGKWSITINKAENAVIALNDNNIIGSITCGTLDLAQSVNVIEGKFPDSTNRDQYNYVNLSVPADLLYPNEPVSKQTLTYELVNNSVQALYLANRVLEQGREDLTVTVNTTYVGIQVSAGDVVSVTNAQYGWNQKLFRCFQVQEAFIDGSLGAQLQLVEYNAQVYDNFDITQFTPAPNTDNPSSYFFGDLTAPTVINPEPSAITPVFDVECEIPTIGRVLSITLFYTTNPIPTVADWKTWGTQTQVNSQPFEPSSSFVFDNLALPADSYYFAYKVSNETSTSSLSPISTEFIWNPAPTSASTFVATFSPATIQVPYVNNAPIFTGIFWRLYGSTNQGGVDFSVAQTDSDSLFVNNSWRIGASSTTGWADIVSTNITIPTLSDGGTYAQWAAPSAMPANTATVSVPVRYKDNTGNISVIPVAILQFAWAQQGTPGTAGTKNAIASLYQWNTGIPSNPNGSSTFTWATLTNGSYTGGGGWSTTIPANSGVPLLQLYEATKGVTAASTATTSTVDWTSGYNLANITANGAAGTQTATPTVYQWAVSIPTGPTGTSTYTWSTGTFTPTPSSWSLTPGTAPSEGYTLWGATVQLITSATSTTSTINWTTSSITARGYAGSDGSNAQILTLGSTAQAVTFNGSGSAEPASQTITFTATVQGLAGVPTFTATAYNASNVSLGNITLGGSAYTRTLTNAQFVTYASTDHVVVTATLSSLTDSITVVRLQDGTAAVSGYLTNEAVTLSATTDGTVTDFTPANGNFKVFSGTTDITSTTTFTKVSNTGCTAAITAGGAISVSAMSTDTATALFQGVTSSTYGSVTIQKTLSLSKSKTGTTGTPGTPGTPGTTGASARICYSKTTLSSLASSPATITTSGSSSFPPNASWGSDTVWQATPPAIVAGESVYQSDGIYSPTTSNTVWNVPYLSALKVGSLSAITANMGSLTSGTITGALIRTAASGQRIEMDYLSNTLRGYDSSGTQLVEIGGNTGSVYATTTLANRIPIVGYGTTYAGGVAGTSTNASGVSGTSSTAAGLYGSSTSGNGVQAITVSGYGVYANSQGVWDFYAGGTAGNYGPFTGAHDCITLTGQTLQPGQILVDEFCACKKNVSSTIFDVALSSTANQVPIGVFVQNNGLLNEYRPTAFVESVTFDEYGQATYVMYPEYDTYKDGYDYCIMNSVGEGQVLVCNEGGDIQAGDYIVTSSINGVGMKQSDNIAKNYTVAKARESVTFSGSLDVKLVACIYMCG